MGFDQGLFGIVGPCEAQADDSFGVNHYSTKWAVDKPVTDDPMGFKILFSDREGVTEREDGTPIGFRGHNGHPYTVPWGFEKLLKHIDATWARDNVTGKHLPIYVTENGFAGPDEGEGSLEEIVDDVRRQEYYDGYLAALVRAKQAGVPIKGYMAWSLLE